MDIKVSIADEADLDRLFEISSQAFARNEPFFDLCYPNHWTPIGRQAGGQRFRAIRNTDPNTVFLKGIDTRTGRIVGMAKWIVYKSDFLPDLTPKPLTGEYWKTDEERELCDEVVQLFLRTRNTAIEQSRGNLLSLDILAVDPEYQRRGVGGALVGWGVREADELGVGAVVESSIPGRGLYEKNGFVFERTVNVTELLPPGRTTLEIGTYAWLTRPARKHTME